MTLGQRIQELRKGMGFSQEELGERMGVSRQAISKWEGDQTIPELDKLIALSKLFGLPIGQLLGVEQSAPTPAVQKPSRRQALLWCGTWAVLLLLIVTTGLLWSQLQALSIQHSMEEEYVLAGGAIFQTAECRLSDIELGFPQARGTQNLTMEFSLKPVKQLKGWTVIGLTASIEGHNPWGKYPDGTLIPGPERQWRSSQDLPAGTSWGTSRASLTLEQYGGETVRVRATLRETKTGRTIETFDPVFIIECDITRAYDFTVQSIEVTEEPAPTIYVPKSIALALPDPRFET